MADAFTYCPIASRFINDVEHAKAYYAFRLVGDHRIEVGGRALVIRFNREEIHLFTDTTHPCPACDQVRRIGASGEVRCFNRERARRLDDVLHTLRNPARALKAKIPGGVLVCGPPGAGHPRMAVVVAPERSVWFVRSAYPMSAGEFAKACRSNTPAAWPPK